MWRTPCCALLRNTRAARSGKPFFARGGAVQGGLEVSFFVGRRCISDRAERQFVATFRVARKSLQLRKLWCRDRDARHL